MCVFLALYINTHKYTHKTENPRSRREEHPAVPALPARSFAPLVLRVKLTCSGRAVMGVWAGWEGIPDQ